jgi:hypothetical protein
MEPAQQVVLFTVAGANVALRAALRRAYRTGETVPVPLPDQFGTCRVVDFAEIASGSEVQVAVTLAPVR